MLKDSIDRDTDTQSIESNRYDQLSFRKIGHYHRNKMPEIGKASPPVAFEFLHSKYNATTN